MKRIASYVALIFVAQNAIAELPKHPNLQPLSLKPLGEVTDVALDIEIKLPKGQSLHARGPEPTLAIYEQINGDWQKTGEVALDGVTSLMNFGTIHLSEHHQLRTQSGPIAIDSTIFHCATSGGYCVIDSFQGIIERRSNLKENHVAILLAGTDPKNLYKKR